MKLNGNYRLRPAIAGTLIAADTSTGPAVFASLDNSEASAAMIAAFVATVAKMGGTVYDEAKKQYIAGPLGVLTEDGTLRLVAEPA